MNDFYSWGIKHDDQKGNWLSPFFYKIYECILKGKYTAFVELRFIGNEHESQIIVADFSDGTIPLRNASGIKRTERIAICYNPKLQIPLDVRSLRKDFPLVLHLNHTYDGEPHSFCLYNELWPDIERKFTPKSFIQRIFWWLRNTAEGKLHPLDQDIEQFYFKGKLFLSLPYNFNEIIDEDDNRLLILRADDEDSGCIYLRAFDGANFKESISAVRYLSFTLPSVGNIPIKMPPRTIGELYIQLLNHGFDLYKNLKESIQNVIPEGGGVKNNAEEKFFLIFISIPRVRDNDIERYDHVCYFVAESMILLGCDLNAIFLNKADGLYYRNITLSFSNDDDIVPDLALWGNRSVDLVEMRSELSAEHVRNISEVLEYDSEFNGVLAGLGSLGSRLADIWARERWGNWTYVDFDIIHPHNLTRHIANNYDIGKSKVNISSMYTQSIYPGLNNPLALSQSILDHTNELQKCMDMASIIVDVTTSLNVPRDLSINDLSPRLASLFLSPTANDSVMLIESKDRNIRMNYLEAQYYRALLDNQEWGEKHLSGFNPELNAGNGCRSISLSFSVEKVYLHAACLSAGLRASYSDDNANIKIWHYDEKTGSCIAYTVNVSSSHEIKFTDWDVIIDDTFISNLYDYRSKELPNETGGVLIGVVDHKLHQILIVSQIYSPVDSLSTPSSYVRGKHDLYDKLEDINLKTGGTVKYIGEWHSHPKHHSATPSITDRSLLDKLSNMMGEDGEPMLMVIVGENEISLTIENCTQKLNLM